MPCALLLCPRCHASQPTALRPLLPPRLPQKGQLGLGDTINRNNPTIVKGLANKKVGAAAVGSSWVS